MTGTHEVGRASWPARYFLITALIPGHLLGWGVEWAFALCTAVAGAVVYPDFHARYPVVSRRALLAIAILTLVPLLSYIGTLLMNRYATGPRDWTDLIRPVLVYFSVTLGFSFGRLTLTEVRRCTRGILAFSVVVAVVLIFRVPGAATIADTIYGSTKTAIGLTSLRVSIPFENPNFLGFFGVISLACALLFSAAPSYVTAGVCLAAIALTGSRTAWLTALMVVLLFAGSTALMATGIARASRRVRIALPFTVSVIVIIGALPWLQSVWENNQRFLDFIDGLLTLQLLNEASYVERQEMRLQAWHLISERLFLGWGALKHSDVEVIDNQYVSLLLRGGVVGLGAAVLAGAAALFTHVRAHRSTIQRAQALAVWVIVLAWLWSGQFIENTRLAVLAFMMLGATTADADA